VQEESARRECKKRVQEESAKKKKPFVTLTVDLASAFSSALSITLPTDFIPQTLSVSLV
jgi:hypothetical protein